MTHVYHADTALCARGERPMRPRHDLMMKNTGWRSTGERFL